MKKIVSSLAIGLACLINFTSCDQDNIADLYESENPNAISFVTDRTDYALEGEMTSVSVPICRANTAEDATVTLGDLATEDPYFTLASNTVTFKAGESTANAVINIDTENMPYGVSFDMGLKLNGEVNSFNHDSIAITISRTLTWTLMKGKGVYVSTLFGATIEVDVLKADQAEIYKVPELYDDGMDIQFQVKKGNKVIVSPQPAWRHSEGIIHVKGVGTIENGVITVPLLHFIPGVGSIGGMPFEAKLHLPK